MPELTTETLPTIPTQDLTQVSGGNAAEIGTKIGGLVDSFSGGQGEGAKLGGEIGGLVQSFLG